MARAPKCGVPGLPARSCSANCVTISSARIPRCHRDHRDAVLAQVVPERVDKPVLGGLLFRTAPRPGLRRMPGGTRPTDGCVRPSRGLRFHRPGRDTATRQRRAIPRRSVTRGGASRHVPMTGSAATESERGDERQADIVVPTKVHHRWTSRLRCVQGGNIRGSRRSPSSVSPGRLRKVVLQEHEVHGPKHRLIDHEPRFGRDVEDVRQYASVRDNPCPRCLVGGQGGRRRPRRPRPRHLRCSPRSCLIPEWHGRLRSLAGGRSIAWARGGGLRRHHPPHG
jgi:hypothetical protein